MARRIKRNYIGDRRSVRMCRRRELGLPERSVVTDASSLSPVSIFVTFVPFVYAIYGRNSVVHFKVNTIASPLHKSPESYSNSVRKTVREYTSVVFEL